MGRTWDNDPQDSETRDILVTWLNQRRWEDFTLDYDTDDYMLMACGLCQFRRRVDYPVTMERLRQVAAEHLVDRHGRAMSDLPTLLVDGDPADWRYRASCGCDRNLDHMMGGEVICHRHGEVQWLAPNDTVRVDGPLPNIREHCDCCTPPQLLDRPLRVDDRVTLASYHHVTLESKLNTPTPFATATVAGLGLAPIHEPPPYWLVTVADVEAL